MANSLIELHNITKCYEVEQDKQYTTLQDINLIVEEGEILAILGPSGSGKSTLLRIIAGLTRPTEGEINYIGQGNGNASPGVAMVFQSFALFPWLTVLDNVMLGLENQNMPSKQKKEKTLQVIDMLGLDGFESAYPKELSGGMRQRVGLGRALVSEPDILLMDEPFSALDVLTAENLRRDILELWLEKKIKTKSVVMVTHSIEEAVYMCDRAVILSSGPARIVKEIRIDIPHWRDRKSSLFLAFIDQIYSLMTKQTMEIIRKPVSMELRQVKKLPNVSIEIMTGFLELLEDGNEKIDLYKLAGKCMMDIESFFPIVDGVALLAFVKVQQGDIELTKVGGQFARASVLERKTLFRTQLLGFVPMISQIVSVINLQNNKKMNVEFLEDILNSYFSMEQAKLQLEILIRWGRYAEVFCYDDKSRQLYIEQEEE